MNPHRTLSYQIQECRRLASYLIDGVRVYSDREIAERLGEDEAWVAGVLYPDRVPAAPPVVPVPTNGPVRPVWDRYDAGRPSVGTVNPIGVPTTMVFDNPSLVRGNGSFGNQQVWYRYDATPRPATADCLGTPTTMAFDGPSHYRGNGGSSNRPVWDRYDEGSARLAIVNPLGALTNMVYDAHPDQTRIVLWTTRGKPNDPAT